MKQEEHVLIAQTFEKLYKLEKRFQQNKIEFLNLQYTFIASVLSFPDTFGYNVLTCVNDDCLGIMKCFGWVGIQSDNLEM